MIYSAFNDGSYLLQSKRCSSTVIQALRGRRDIAPTLDLRTRWGEWSESRPGRDLPPEKGPPVPVVQETGWASEPVWTQRLQEVSFCVFRKVSTKKILPVFWSSFLLHFSSLTPKEFYQFV
jgi:hypothetical protein